MPAADYFNVVPQQPSTLEQVYAQQMDPANAGLNLWSAGVQRRADINQFNEQAAASQAAQSASAMQLEQFKQQQETIRSLIGQQQTAPLGVSELGLDPTTAQGYADATTNVKESEGFKNVGAGAYDAAQGGYAFDPSIWQDYGVDNTPNKTTPLGVERQRISAGATTGAATISANARVQAAKIAADAKRATAGSGSKGTKPKVEVTDNIGGRGVKYSGPDMSSVLGMTTPDFRSAYEARMATPASTTNATGTETQDFVATYGQKALAMASAEAAKMGVQAGDILGYDETKGVPGIVIGLSNGKRIRVPINMLQQ